MKTVTRSEPNSTPEAAMDELLSKSRFVFGDKPWEAWRWEAREYGTREPRTIRFRYQDGAFVRVVAN